MPGRRRPAGGQQPLRVIPAAHPDGQVRQHPDSQCGEGPGRTHPGEHQQVGGFQRPRREHHPVRIEAPGSIRPGEVDPDRAAGGDPHPGGPGVGEHGQVRPPQRGFQERRARTHSDPAGDVQRHRTHPGRGAWTGRGGIEVGQPAEPGVDGGTDERPRGEGPPGRGVRGQDPPDRDRAAAAGVGEVPVGGDGAVVRFDVGPGPAGHRVLVEVGGQRPAEIAPVDRPGAAHTAAPDDLRGGPRVLGQGGAIPPGHRAGGFDRQPIGRVGERADRRGGPGRAGLQHRDPAGRVGGQPFGQNGSRAAGTDDHDVSAHPPLPQPLMSGRSGRRVRSRMTPAQSPAP